MKKEYMLKRLVKFYSRLGVKLSLNYLGVVCLHHDCVKRYCFYPSITLCYEITFGHSEINPFRDGSKFFVCNSDGSTTPSVPD